MEKEESTITGERLLDLIESGAIEFLPGQPTLDDDGNWVYKFKFIK